MRKAPRWVLAIVIAQATLIGIYWWVEHNRGAQHVKVLGTEPPRRVDMALPSIRLRGREGENLELAASSRPTVVHVWATWCPPCRDELPGLLKLPTEHDVDVIAIALDQRFVDVDRFLDGLDGSRVFLGSGDEVERALGVSRLPATFLLEVDGRITLRVDGARDWTNPAFVRDILEQLENR